MVADIDGALHLLGEVFRLSQEFTSIDLKLFGCIREEKPGKGQHGRWKVIGLLTLFSGLAVVGLAKDEAV